MQIHKIRETEWARNNRKEVYMHDIDKKGI